MTKRNIIVIGASAGGFDAVKKLIAALPPYFDASIFIVWHLSPDIKGILPDVLNKLNTIRASNARDKEPILPNRIYVAPPDHHLLIEQGRMRVTHGPKENRFRPAVDSLFRSAAHAYGAQVIGIVLSGALDDGTAGLWRIKFDGGITVVQDPAEAEVPSMPENAIAEVSIDYCLPILEIAKLLIEFSKEDILNDQVTDGLVASGLVSPYICPECHESLSKIMDGASMEFRCSTGHIYSAYALTVALSAAIDNNLNTTILGLAEKVLLLNDLGDHYAETNQPKVAAIYFQKAREAKEKSDIILKTIHNNEELSKYNG